TTARARRNRLGRHAFGGNPNQGLFIFPRAGIRQTLDVAVFAPELKLVEREPDGVLDGYCLYLNTGEPLVASHIACLVSPGCGVRITVDLPRIVRRLARMLSALFLRAPISPRRRLGCAVCRDVC